MTDKHGFYNRINELKTLLSAFEQEVIQNHGVLSYVVRGNKDIGKTRLIEEFLKKIEGIEYLSEIPDFKVQQHVFVYECKKGENEPYNAFINITKEIYEKTKLIRIVYKAIKVILSIFGINDVLDALTDFKETLSDGENFKPKKEAGLFNKYRKLLKRKSKKAPIIIFIKNIQWIDSMSLILIKKIIKNPLGIRGMIILEEDNDSINDVVHNELNNLILEKKLNKLYVPLLDKSFPGEFLKSRFGKNLFTYKELELLYAISEGCPGKLINYIEQTCIPQGWLIQKNGEWIKTDNFYEKIKPLKQRLIDVIITMFEDNILSQSEYNTLLHMASVWGMQTSTVKVAVAMIGEIVENGYKIISNLGPGILSENSFLVADNKDNRFIIEYIKNDFKENIQIEKRKISHKNLFEAHEIKVSNKGVLIIWDYFESNRTRTEMIEAFENQIRYTVNKFTAIGEGLSELHKNNIFHGYLRPETIIENKNGEFQLASFDNGLLKYLIKTNENDFADIHYQSPEQLKNGKVELTSDIFSLGVLLYKSLTNQFPFNGNTKEELIESIKNGEINYFGPFFSLIPEKLKKIIKKSLSYSPDDRYKNAMEFLDDLNKIHNDTVELKHTENKNSENINSVPKKQTGKNKITVSFILILFFVLAGGYYFLLNKKTYIIQPNEIVVAVKNDEKDTTAKAIQYLISKILAYQNDNLSVKSENEFKKGNPSGEKLIYVPEIKINLTLKKQKFRYKLVFDIEKNKKDKSEKVTKVISFNDITAFLKEKLDALSFLSSILFNSDARLKKFIFTKSWDAYSNYFNGEMAWSKVNPINAREFYRKAIQIDPNFVQAKLGFAEVCRFEGNNHLSQRFLKSVIPFIDSLDKVDSLRVVVLKSKLNGDYKSVISTLHSIADIKNEKKETYYHLAEAYFEIRDIDNAKKNYKKSLDLDSNFIPAINHYAYCFTHLGKHKEALKYFKKYLKNDSSANAFNSYADGLMACGKLDSAEWVERMGIKKDPELTYLYSSLSYIHIRKGQFDNALKDVNSYLKTAKTPDKISYGLVNKAMIYYFKNDLTKALDTCKRAIDVFDTADIATRNHRAHWLLTLIYLQKNDKENVKNELNKMDSLINKYGVNTYYYNKIYKFYHHCKAIEYFKMPNYENFEKELNIFNEIKNKIKDWSSPYDQAFFYTDFGKLYYLNKEYDKAENELKRALEYNPNYALAHYYLYRTYLEKNKFSEASGNLEIFLSKWSHADTNTFYIKDTVEVNGNKIPEIILRIN